MLSPKKKKLRYGKNLIWNRIKDIKLENINIIHNYIFKMKITIVIYCFFLVLLMLIFLFFMDLKKKYIYIYIIYT